MSYHNDPKFSDRQVWANSVDPDQTNPKGLGVWSDQGLSCLPFRLYLLAVLVYVKITLFKF